MPRRLDPKACGCGCGQITKSGEFMRGHHTKRRWELVKAAATHVETHNVTRLRTGENVNSQLAYGELARRGWIIPDTYRHFGVELEIVARNDAQVNDVLRSLNVNFSTGGYHARGGAGQWMVTRDSSLRGD
jgi:hypothetical protein